MAIDLNTLVLTAREQLTELPESVQFSRENLRALIAPAISAWQEQTNDDPNKRQPFIVESGAITIVNGLADILAEVEARGFRLDFIKDSDIEIAYAKTPVFQVKFVNSLDRLQMHGRQDRFLIKVYRSGTRFYFKDAGATDITSMNGSFTLRSVVIPNDPAQLPASVMPQIATAIADLARKQLAQQNRGLNMPPK
jgi:hypothetical protein